MQNLLVSLWLTVMATFAPSAPRDRLEVIARTVVTVTDDPQEQALLLTISFYETTFGRRGIPFGISSVNRTGHTLLDDAQSSLRILRRSRVRCNVGYAPLLGHYHHGNGCRADEYSLRESDTVRRMLSIYNRQALASGAPVPRVPLIVLAADTRRHRP